MEKDGEKLDQKRHYSFRSFMLTHDLDKQNNAFEIRITTNMTYVESKAIMITISDISKHLRSLYYKNMNMFKSKLIKSISHELRTRLNII